MPSTMFSTLLDLLQLSKKQEIFIPIFKSSLRLLAMKGTLGNIRSDSLMQHSKYFMRERSADVTGLPLLSPKISSSS